MYLNNAVYHKKRCRYYTLVVYFQAKGMYVFMDTQKLRDNYLKLIAHMKETGYSADYVKRVENEIIRIIAEANSKNWGSYADIYLEYEKDTNAPSRLNNKRAYLSLIKEFDEYDRYPDGRQRQKVVRNDNYSRLLPEFKAVIDYYRVAEELRGKKKRKRFTPNLTAQRVFYSHYNKAAQTHLRKLRKKMFSQCF